MRTVRPTPSPTSSPAGSRRLLAVCPVSHPGGGEIGLLRLLERLGPRGWQITLATPGSGPLSEDAERHGWAHERVALGPLGATWLPTPRALASWPRARLLAARADVVYLNGTTSGRLLPALGTRARRVLHVHDMVERVPDFWRRADVVLADSGAVAARLPGLHAHVVWCPVEPDPPHVKAPWAPGEGPVVGFVGRIEPRKAPLDLVRAAPALKARVGGVRIVIVGGDPFDADPDYLAEVRSGSGVEHYGWVSGAAGLMRHLDVLVLPSHREPFGTVLAEAMAVGTPVVATHVDGLPEVVEDGVSGILVAPGDPAALADAVVGVLDRRAEMGAAARERAVRFHAEAYADRVEALIAP